MEVAKEIFRIKPMNLHNQKMDKEGDLHFEFYDNYFKYVCKFYAEEPKNRDDHNLGWDTVFNIFEVVVNKTSVAGIDKSFVNQYNHWSVYIFVNGMPDDIKIFFETQSEADKLVDKLLKYLYDLS